MHHAFDDRRAQMRNVRKFSFLLLPTLFTPSAPATGTPLPLYSYFLLIRKWVRFAHVAHSARIGERRQRVIRAQTAFILRTLRTLRTVLRTGLRTFAHVCARLDEIPIINRVSRRVRTFPCIQPWDGDQRSPASSINPISASDLPGQDDGTSGPR